MFRMVLDDDSDSLRMIMCSCEELWRMISKRKKIAVKSSTDVIESENEFRNLNTGVLEVHVFT